MLAEVFGRPPHAEIDPDQAVAVGVAVQGRKLGEDWIGDWARPDMTDCVLVVAGILAGAWPLQVSAIEIPFQADQEL